MGDGEGGGRWGECRLGQCPIGLVGVIHDGETGGGGGGGGLKKEEEKSFVDYILDP